MTEDQPKDQAQNQKTREDQRKQDEVIKRLEEDKKKLEEKTKNLAKILELSAKQKTKARPAAELKGIQDELKAYTDEVKKNIKNLGKKLEKQPTAPDILNQQVMDILKPFEEKIAVLERIPDLETRLSKLEEPAEETPKKKPKDSLFGGFSEEGIESEELDKRLLTLQENTDARLKTLEDSLNAMRMTLGPQTLNEIRKLADTGSDILTIGIPAKVREEVEKILSSFSAEFRLLTQSLKNLSDEVERSNSEIFFSLEEVERLGNNMERLEKRIDDMHKDLFRSSRNKGI